MSSTKEPTSIEQPERVLYAKLKAASDEFGVLRQEPYFSTAELDELVVLAASVSDLTGWLRAQRDTAESRLQSTSPNELAQPSPLREAPITTGDDGGLAARVGEWMPHDYLCESSEMRLDGSFPPCSCGRDALFAQLSQALHDVGELEKLRDSALNVLDKAVRTEVAERDSERLDWLESADPKVFETLAYKWTLGESIRALIDAARSPSRGAPTNAE